MKILKVTLHLIEQPLLSPFTTSLATVNRRESILVEISGDKGHIGWGEVVAFSSPWYTEETIKTCWHIMEDFLIPLVLNQQITHPTELTTLFSSIKRHNMAKAGIETACWDLFAKEEGIPLSKAIGGSRVKIEAGVVVSLTTIDQMLFKIEEHLNQGYKRIKIKISPGKEYQIVKRIFDEFPNIPLMVDANSAYQLKDIHHLQALDEFGLMMIEQPLGYDDIIDHAILQKELQTPICLDESIVTYEDARKAIELGSCRIMNIKVGRVGGLTEAIKIHNLCLQHNIPVWVGGMLETGISRAHNIHLASLSNFTIPGDISASSRYWKQDIIIPEVQVEKGNISVPETRGIGFEVNVERIQAITKEQRIYT